MHVPSVFAEYVEIAWMCWSGWVQIVERDVPSVGQEEVNSNHSCWTCGDDDEVMHFGTQRHIRLAFLVDWGY